MSVHLRLSGMRSEPHLLICSSICRTSIDSPPPRGSGSGLFSLGGGPLASGLLRPSSERTRFDRMSRMVNTVTFDLRATSRGCGLKSY
ncbi:hypothetical protein EYF80_044121 [Liparis tanakae]|uniref:Uncharacterized protein n=1 Tax=Liparis tanakae TaxID=230148 RepID=A0A4Z2FZB0_9TELE|nr:hypothetical protein EYF80_044121 [Liparis tanakae]